MVKEMATSATAATSSPIKTIVVLVQENRSFDHILGWFKTLNPEINGVTGSESNPISTTSTNDLTSNTNLLFNSNSTSIDPDPGHSFAAIYEQLYGHPWTETDADDGQNPKPSMLGFAQNAERIKAGMSENVMNGFKPEMLPVFKELVEEYAVCDRWFASAPTLTQPNRLFIHSATSYGATENDTKMLIEGYPQKTIFDSLDENGFSFGIYYQSVPSTLFYKNLRKLKYINNFHQFDLKFKRHCKKGKLPNYVVIEQRYYDMLSLPANDDHPPHHISEGQKFVKEIYEALRSSPQWNETLLLIVYDEHGGFYDHVPPPVTGVPSPDDIVGPPPYNYKFDTLGVRVPAILVSPWIERGTVMHGPSGPYPSSEFEHSSIPATVKRIFNLPEFLTKRDAWAGTFDSVINRTSPRTDLPETLSGVVIEPRDTVAEEDANLNDFQEELVQLAATLIGDHKKESYPDKLVKSMVVSQAVSYVEDAMMKFCDVSERAKENGVNESEIVVFVNSGDDPATTIHHKSLAQKIFSCLTCDH
ncbi:hypothetical protein ACFE04_028901 [Oxalis oulophora]